MRIRVTKCSDCLYWYSKHVGTIFKVEYVSGTDGSYWCRELDEYHALNFVKKQDAELIDNATHTIKLT